MGDLVTLIISWINKELMSRGSGKVLYEKVDIGNDGIYIGIFRVGKERPILYGYGPSFDRKTAREDLQVKLINSLAYESNDIKELFTV
jgi:hypothetical protein